MKQTLLALALGFMLMPVPSFAHEAQHDPTEVSMAECDCPSDCPCKAPGGTCPKDGPCVPECDCDNKKKSEIWFHPDTLEAIKINEEELKLLSDGGLRKFKEPTNLVDGELRLTGYKPVNKQYKDAVFKHFPIWEGKHAGEDLPKTLNYLKIAPPNIQRQLCGDCWAQGAALAFEGVIGWLDKASRYIGRQPLIDCSGHGSCGGGYASVVKFFESPKGAVYNSDYPYAGVTQRCKSASLIYREKARKTGFIRGINASRPKVSDYQRAMFEKGPIEVCGASSSLGGADSDGFILRNRSGGTDHCWAAYGWVRGEDYGKPAGIYFIMANSWGKNWGKNGIVYLRVAQNDVDLDGSAVTEGAYIDYKDAAPPEPVTFKMDSIGAELEITVQPELAGRVEQIKQELREGLMILEKK